ncbi:fatty acid desaturase [Rhodobacteraceae bacterium 2376]|uniref:Fatty acid desaturase n=1 Tax=Rhabdonatronobacter sediminivivens TaxID=2743469 RepID=A0A7Z0I1L7_9RHOB|nr:fatty acid desaturase [Rhabdonatronobacter sediminivivens]NYS26238.1 fatty acid desaturase [Rhabdonatronobacter sediminivivens]
MTQPCPPDPHADLPDRLDDPRAWIAILAQYRTPSNWRSTWEIVVTAVPLLALWALAWWSVGINPALAVALSVLNGAFLVRLFMIQHDCGHAAFFSSRRLSNWVGRAIGVLTLTPYDAWRRVHAEHHADTGNLDRRGMGDIRTLTVDEYRSLSPLGRLGYRLYRHPVVMFGIGPFVLFFISNRVPVGLMRNGARYWISAMGTNAAIATLAAGIWYLGGGAVLAFVFLPTLLVASSIGVWLFFVQHQFEETSWNHNADWQVHDAALHGSSHYVLPGILRWFTANIGVHHVHHLQARIPFYRLPEVLRDHPQLADAQRLTLRESFACARKHLWDETTRRLVPFAAVRAA